MSHLQSLSLSIFTGLLVSLPFAFADPLLIVLIGLPASGVLYIGTLIVSAWRRRHPERPVRGWQSKVTEVTPSDDYPELWLLMFRLYGPDGKRADANVTCQVGLGDQTYESKRPPTFDEVNLQPGEPPHYVAFFPESFFGASRENGDYEVRWYEQYGLGSRLLAKPHRFRIRGGRVRGAKREKVS